MYNKTILSILMLIILSNSGYSQSYISQSIQYDGESRQYEIYVPEIYDGTVNVPLVFSRFHGGSGTIADQIGIGDFSSYADTANFIAVYPQALRIQMMVVQRTGFTRTQPQSMMYFLSMR